MKRLFSILISCLVLTTVQMAPVSGFSRGVISKFNCSFNGKPLYGKIYFTKYDFQADVKIYKTRYDFQSNIKVYPVKYDFQAKSCGLWYPVKYAFQADTKVYVVKYDFQADVKYYVVKYDFQAGLH